MRKSTLLVASLSLEETLAQPHPCCAQRIIGTLDQTNMLGPVYEQLAGSTGVRANGHILDSLALVDKQLRRRKTVIINSYCLVCVFGNKGKRRNPRQNIQNGAQNVVICHHDIFRQLLQPNVCQMS